MGFYDKLEGVSDWIDDEIEYFYYSFSYYFMRDYWFVLLLGRQQLNDALREYSCYTDLRGGNEVEDACYRAAELKSIELINQHKFWWMKEFKVKEKP